MRLPFADIARGVAYVLMIVAHTAPSDGPARILITSEFLTAPLFAMLVGVGAGLSRIARPASGAVRAEAGDVAGTCARALVVGVCGWALIAIPAPMPIVVVLVHLAVLTALMWPIALLPTSAVAALAAAAGAASAVLVGLAPAVGAGGGALRLLTSGPYFPLAFLAYACLGLILARIAVRSSSPVRLLASAALLAGIMLGSLVVPNLLGYGVHAYSGTWLETIGDAAGAAAIVLACTGLGGILEARGADAAARILAVPGQASLSLYVGHALVLSAWVASTGERPARWGLLAALIVGGLAAAWIWHALMRRVPLPAALAGLRRGPLEAVSQLAAGTARGVLAGAARPRAAAPNPQRGESQMRTR